MKRKQLDRTLLDWIKSEGGRNAIPETALDDHVVLGRFNAGMLAILKCVDLEIVTSVAVLDKMLFDHGISINKLERLHSLICSPIKVYQSATQSTSVVIMTVELHRGKPILLPIWLNKPGATGKPPMHWLSSGYTKDNPNWQSTWDSKGLLLWQK